MRRSIVLSLPENFTGRWLDQRSLLPMSATVK
jgi:hypothetical protein